MTLRAHRHFETTPPAIVTCWRCGRPTVYGLAEGVISRTDITPINPATELRAIRAGRLTYTLRRTGLIQRDTGRRTDPNLAAPVLAEHCCAPRRTA